MIDSKFLEILACPACKSNIKLDNKELICTNEKCKLRFPVVNGIPVMLVKGTSHHEFQKKYFDKDFKSYEEYKLENWRKSYLKRIFMGLNIENSQNDLYLDVGVGGSGYTVIEAARKGHRSIGVDISLEGIKKAQFFATSELGKKSNLCNFAVCLAENLPFKDNTVTKLSSIAVLEHIPNDNQAIAEIARVTKPNAKIFITVPNSYQRIPPIFWIPYYIHDKRIGHLRHYKAEDLIAKFFKYDFVVEDVLYNGHLIKIVQIFLRFISPKFESSKLWWNLEEMDLKRKKIDHGLHLHLVMKKVAG